MRGLFSRLSLEHQEVLDKVDYYPSKPMTPIKVRGGMMLKGCTYTGDAFGYVKFDNLPITDAPARVDGIYDLEVPEAKPDCADVIDPIYFAFRFGSFTSPEGETVCPAD